VITQTASFTCTDLQKAYATRSGAVLAIDALSFGVGVHEFVCIVGPSGCGKTTLLKLVAGLIEPTRGSIAFGPTTANGAMRTALVFQEHGLFPWMSVVDNVAFGLEWQRLSREARRLRAREFIERVGLAPFADNYPHELSVGMRQRVGIARAFVANPEILLMDEPFGALDAQTKLVLQEELVRIWTARQKAVVYVTHDIEEAVLLGDRVLVMSGRPGRIREEIRVPMGRPRDLLDPDHPAVQEIRRHVWSLLESDVRHSVGLD
jgi:NitT/TauT family transport system ATP-binding protein